MVFFPLEIFLSWTRKSAAAELSCGTVQEVAAAGVQPPSHPTITSATADNPATAAAPAPIGKRRRVLPAHLRDSDLGDATCSPAAAALASSSSGGGVRGEEAANVQQQQQLLAPPPPSGGPVCVCRGAAGGDGVACCSCRDWYHLRCVSVGQVQAKTLRGWTCPVCEAVRVRLRSVGGCACGSAHVSAVFLPLFFAFRLFCFTIT